ncbi:MAG: carbonic anhydrase [Anaerolineaceae bacterium]|nr:carbonic anhydrase [Anaerolineaceae bacterium]
MKNKSKDTLDLISPAKALALLKEGNQRFVKGKLNEKNFQQQIQDSSEGQYPFAVVLGCVDSRVSPELVFDKGVGDIFSIRIAGNIVNEDILGSMEFACNVVGSKHILVLGHTSCGAIQGAYDDVKLGNLTGLVEKIKPAVQVVRDASSGWMEIDIDQIAEENVHQTIEQIKQNSPVLKEMFDNGKIGISGGMYDVSTGEVKFFD